MTLRYRCRRLFDLAFSSLPQSIHTGLLKSYSYMPELSLKSGFRCFPQVFYSPLVDPNEIKIDLLGTERHLPGIHFDSEAIFGLLAKLAPYTGEVDWIPKDGRQCAAWSEAYTTLDSAILYCLIRHLKPKRFIEVGCGSSSAISSDAIRKNRMEGHECEATFIEPYPGPRLEGVNLAGELLVKKIEDVPLDYFSGLGANDILFIDTSHVLKCQNDVEYELLHILPSLNQGVYIHIHDIYTPFDQPKDWLLDRLYPGWSNEQYAVECLLSGGRAFETVAPLYWLGAKHRDRVLDFVGTSNDRGQAYWIRKTC